MHPQGLWLRKAQTIQNRKSILQREETKEDIAETGSEEEESDVPVEREEGYYGWKQELPQSFSFCSGGGSL